MGEKKVPKCSFSLVYIHLSYLRINGLAVGAAVVIIVLNDYVLLIVIINSIASVMCKVGVSEWLSLLNYVF